MLMPLCSFIHPALRIQQFTPSAVKSATIPKIMFWIKSAPAREVRTIFFRATDVNIFLSRTTKSRLPYALLNAHVLSRRIRGGARCVLVEVFLLRNFTSRLIRMFNGSVF